MTPTAFEAVGVDVLSRAVSFPDTRLRYVLLEIRYRV